MEIKEKCWKYGRKKETKNLTKEKGPIAKMF